MTGKCFSFSLCSSGNPAGFRPREAWTHPLKADAQTSPCRGQASSSSRGPRPRACRCWPSFWPHHTQLGPTPAQRSQITVQWSQRDAASIHKQQRCTPRLLFDILSMILCYHLALNSACSFCADSQEVSKLFRHRWKLLISRPDRLDRHLGSAAGGEEGKAGR